MTVHSITSARYAGDKRYGSVDYPTLLTSVCSYWRYIATSTPMLWNYVDLTRSRDTVRSFEYAKLYLERSRNMPLWVHLGKLDSDATERTLAPDTPSSRLTKVRKLPEHMGLLLAENAPRIRSLALNATCTDIAVDVLSTLLLSGADHPLQELALQIDQTYGVSPPSNTQFSRLFNPLRVLHLQGLRMDPNTILCGGLVELCLVNCYNATAADIANLLNSNPSLCSLVFKCLNDPRLPDPGSCERIHLPNLRSLDFSAWLDFTTWFFNVLETGLYALDFRFCHYTPSGNMAFHPTMTDFFIRTPITMLRLTGDRLPLPLVLASSPHVQRLELRQYYIFQSTFDGIEHVADKITELHTIDLVECQVYNYANPSPGLRVLLTLPSVRQINYFPFGDPSKPGDQDMFRDLLRDESIRAQVTEAPELSYHASPFHLSAWE